MKISELPQELKEKALEYQRNSLISDKKTDSLLHAFDWGNTKEGYHFWQDLYYEEPKTTDSIVESVANHYDNSNGSIYKFCEDQKLNAYEFDLIKRIVRCRKKGQFLEDLQKTKVLIDLYLQEFKPE